MREIHHRFVYTRNRRVSKNSHQHVSLSSLNVWLVLWLVGAAISHLFSTISHTIISLITMNKHNHHLFFTQLQALKPVSKHLQNATVFTSSINHTTSIIKPFLDLHFEPHSVFSNLNHHLSTLKTQLENLEKCPHFTLRCFLIRYRITRLGFDIYKEIQRFQDRVIGQNLVEKLEIFYHDDDKIEALVEFIDRLREGFDGDFQELVLKAKVFSILEKLICDDDDDIINTCSKRVKEAVSLAIEALVRFNRNVFLGLVMMGSTIRALISMKSSCSIQVLSSLIKLIRSPLVDELHSINRISEIITLL